MKLNYRKSNIIAIANTGFDTLISKVVFLILYTFLNCFNDSLLDHAQSPHAIPFPGGEGIATPTSFGLSVSHIFYGTRGDAQMAGN